MDEPARPTNTGEPKQPEPVPKVPDAPPTTPPSDTPPPQAPQPEEAPPPSPGGAPAQEKEPPSPPSPPGQPQAEETPKEEKDQESSLPPIISPPAPKRSKAKIVGTILALLVLLISLPAGVILVQRAQEIRERARVVECVDDFECASGYKCINNRCVKATPAPTPTPLCKGKGGLCGPTTPCCDPYQCVGGVCETAPTKTKEPGTPKPKPEPSPTKEPGTPKPKPTPTASPPPVGATWYQCQVTDGPEPNLPCGSCSITSVGAGTMTFSCELDCGGIASRCPGGSAGSYSTAHRWERCKNKGGQACTGASSDYIESGDLGGPGPWTIAGQSTVNGSGTFPNPGCGRVQVDVQMSAQGTNVAGRVFDTGTDCAVGPTPVPPAAGSCRNIKVYDTNWNQLAAGEITPGTTIRIAVSGGAGTYDRGRFRVNSGAWLPSSNGTNNKNPFGEFYTQYTIPSGATSLTLEAMVHHVETNDWY